jgi:pimeloyl-ACP methyl ester carboxylesterase
MIKDKYTPDEDYTQKKLFITEASSEYVKMSDEAELKFIFTKKGKHPCKFSILFVPGFGTFYASWNDLWDELSNLFDLYVIDKRELRSSRVRWKHKATMDRLAEDLKDAVEHFKLDQKKLVLMGPCLGSSIIAHAVASKKLQPAGVILNSPPRRFVIPYTLLPLAYILPAFFMGIIGKPLIKTWLKITMKPSLQRETYLENINNASGMRWKKFLKITHWDSFDDYSLINCPAFVTGASEDRIHENKIAKEAAELIKNVEFMDTPSYYWSHYYPGILEYREKIEEFISSLAK